MRTFFLTKSVLVMAQASQQNVPFDGNSELLSLQINLFKEILLKSRKGNIGQVCVKKLAWSLWGSAVRA